MIQLWDFITSNANNFTEISIYIFFPRITELFLT